MVPAVQKALLYSEDSERAVLGSILLDPSLLTTVSERLHMEDFFDERHQLLYQSLVDLKADQIEIDLRTVQSRLQQREQLDSAGGVAYLCDLDLDLPDIGRFDTYVTTVKECAVRRKLIQVSGQAISDGLDVGFDIGEAVGRTVRAISELKEEEVTQREFAQFSDALHLTLEEMEERSGSALTGLPTGFVDFDRLSQGLHKGNLIIVASLPGMGKTSFALNIAQHVAIRERKEVGIFSLEMSQQDLALRILCSEAGISFSRLRSNRLSQKEWTRIIQAVRSIGDAPLFISDPANLTLFEVEAKARHLKKEKGLVVLILDYLQLMQGGSNNSGPDMGTIIRGLKHLAREQEICLIALSQLSRPERVKGQRPQLSDLGEDLNLDQDADMVVFIHREEKLRPREENKGLAELIIAKHRNGETGTIELVFLEGITTFQNLFQAENE